MFVIVPRAKCCGVSAAFVDVAVVPSKAMVVCVESSVPSTVLFLYKDSCGCTKISYFSVRIMLDFAIFFLTGSLVIWSPATGFPSSRIFTSCEIKYFW